MRSAIAEGLRGMLDEQHLQVALEFWDMMYAQQTKQSVPQFLSTVGGMLGITEMDQVKAHKAVMSALSRQQPA